jgi:hypothetical protein
MNHSFTNEEILEAWEEETDLEIRDTIVAEMEKRGLFPNKSQFEYESRTGAYPDVRDPVFLQKLLARREFAESKQSTWIPKSEESGEFEVTPVQRFCANLMSPRTPYQSALLYHGVGVGKTCAAIQIAENWLSMYPRKKVIIISPRNIKAGFERTIFNMDRLVVPEDADVPNHASQCTGSTYLELTNTLYEKNPKKVQSRVEDAIRRRYVLLGYLAFANYIENLLKPAKRMKTEEKRMQEEARLIRQNFSGRLVIIDEVHNLKELPDTVIGAEVEAEDEDTTGPGGELDQKDSIAGKKLTPFLDKVLTHAEGMKLVLMSATPMYNSYREIIFLLNLMLKNDKQATIREQDIFLPNGEFREGGETRLGYIAQRYISFMRGENPLTFPIRLFPAKMSKEGITPYPTKTPRGGFVNLDESQYINYLPIVPTVLHDETLNAVREFSAELPPGEGGISSIQLDKIIQAGNLVVPNPPDETYSYRQRTDVTALSLHFQTSVVGGEMQWSPRYEGAADWLLEGQIGKYAPKYKTVLDSLRSAEGVCFVYTRFVNAGAVPFALMLEANGYTPYGRRTGLLANVPRGGRICSRCGMRENGHISSEHEFNPARYILLTGDTNISPKNAENIVAESSEKNYGGDVIKVVIGSQVASEGVDLKYVREIHVIDPWFHLNKTEQILGRGIRFRSHMALPKEKRNTTIYLHAAVRPAEDNMESGDIYSYRVAFRKGQQMGKVNRVLKQYAVDCNLNRDAILINDAAPIEQIDSQGVDRGAVSIVDQPFTAVCDWLDTCDYKCIPDITVDPLKASDVSYDGYAIKWREAQLKERLRNIFRKQVFYKSEQIWDMFADVPKQAVAELLINIIGNRTFTVTNNERDGYLIYRNGYYLFQPKEIVDLSVPIALRVSKIPVRRDVYQPAAAAAAPGAIAAATGVGEEVAAKAEAAVAEAETDLDYIYEIWNEWNDWIESLIVDAEGNSDIPDIISVFVYERSKKNQREHTRRMQRYEMFPWVAIALSPWTDEKKDTFRRVGAEFFWDEELNDSDRSEILKLPSLENVPENMREVIKGAFIKLPTQTGVITIRKIFTAMNNRLEYICNGSTCPASIMGLIERDTNGRIDAVRALKVTKDTTGELYGLNVPKRGNFIFKTNVPPATAGGKLSQGEDIGNQSMMSGHYDKMERLGNALKKAGKDILDMKPGVFKGERKIVNAVRIATVINIVLRVMDKWRVDGKRWFYRALEANAVGHKGDAVERA